MTFEEVKKLMSWDTLIRRACWDMLEAVSFGNNEGIRCYPIEDAPDEDVGPADSFVYYLLDNYDGTRCGTVSPYEPSRKDREATDWEVYTPPTEEQIENYEADPSKPRRDDYPFFK